ncbi:hypothetical protein BJ875DRAFT_25570 [Amylocarpus encephaloides]|uniref:Uncharacterized protein n=1 Tax=Amylocarpus encephaloides TaxID=45428 RepID=A0A9P8C4X5_9HELO|nr:hypothetical protein BJ875DRAFT_25570 [Amylocarpus encephaloides]
MCLKFGDSIKCRANLEHPGQATFYFATVPVVPPSSTPEHLRSTFKVLALVAVVVNAFIVTILITCPCFLLLLHHYCLSALCHSFNSPGNISPISLSPLTRRDNLDNSIRNNTSLAIVGLGQTIRDSSRRFEFVCSGLVVKFKQRLHCLYRLLLLRRQRTEPSNFPRIRRDSQDRLLSPRRRLPTEDRPLYFHLYQRLHSTAERSII